MSTEQYQDKLAKYIESIQNYMYTFEITKCCDYSTFVTIYKDETLIDLYAKIILHFGGMPIKELYFFSETGEKIFILPSYTRVYEFVKENVICKPRSLVPHYPVPNPIVYKLYVDDGSDHDHCFA
jgi:hypothetical protein